MPFLVRVAGFWGVSEGSVKRQRERKKISIFSPIFRGKMRQKSSGIGIRSLRIWEVIRCGWTCFLDNCVKLLLSKIGRQIIFPREFFSPTLLEATVYFQQNATTFIPWGNGVSRGACDCLIQILPRITPHSYILFQMPLS